MSFIIPTYNIYVYLDEIRFAFLWIVCPFLRVKNDAYKIYFFFFRRERHRPYILLLYNIIHGIYSDFFFAFRELTYEHYPGPNISMPKDWGIRDHYYHDENNIYAYIYRVIKIMCYKNTNFLDTMIFNIHVTQNFDHPVLTLIYPRIYVLS